MAASRHHGDLFSLHSMDLLPALASASPIYHNFFKGTSRAAQAIETTTLRVGRKSANHILMHGKALPSSLEISRRRNPNTTVRATSEPVVPVTEKVNSILCNNCEGNGAVVCSQCNGAGLNGEDHFGGRFKAGTICWLCRGKKQMLCGNCNGAGFMGGFLNTQDD